MMKLEAAQTLAKHLINYMMPNCERIELAGSCRRGCREVKDLEIVVVPAYTEKPDPSNLFGDKQSVNLLYEQMDRQEFVQWIKPGTKIIEPWPLKPDGRYWRGLVRQGHFDAPADIKLLWTR